MLPNEQLSPGFVTLEEACDLIKSDTRENPVIDMDYIVAHKIWIEPRHNFRIPKIRQLKPEEVRKTRRGRIIDYEEVGNAYVYVRDNYDAEILKRAINDKYRELVGHEYKETVVKHRSSVADDAQGREAVRPRVNDKPIAKEGDYINSGSIVDTNGDGLAV